MQVGMGMKGNKWDNSNSVINEIYFEKLLFLCIEKQKEILVLVPNLQKY